MCSVAPKHVYICPSCKEPVDLYGNEYDFDSIKCVCGISTLKKYLQDAYIYPDGRITFGKVYKGDT